MYLVPSSYREHVTHITDAANEFQRLVLWPGYLTCLIIPLRS